MGEKESALADFEAAILIEGDEQLHLMVATIFYQDNRLADAREHLRDVLRFNPSNTVAKEYLAKVDREMVEEGFREKESFHFHVKYEGAAAGTTGHVVSMVLEEAYHKVGAELGFYPEDMITAILYTQQQFRDITRSPSWSGGLYDGKIRLPVGGVNSRSDELARVVYHEYTHALVHRMTDGNCPVWLNEGIAQYEEGGESLARAEDIVRRSGAILPLKYLEGSFMGLDSSSASIAYAMSMLAVDYIIREYGTLYVANILEELGTGKRGEEAIASAIFISYGDIEKGVMRRLENR